MKQTEINESDQSSYTISNHTQLSTTFARSNSISEIPSKLDANGIISQSDDERFKKMCAAVRTLLECIGENPERPGLQATPSRYANALLDLTRGYQMDIDSIINNALFYEGHNELVVVKDIDIYSLCEHHLLPFIGKMHIGYIPIDTVIGLSKLPRIAELCARRLQIQERLTKEVADAIMQALKPRGVAVIMEASHCCMLMRGVEKAATTTITNCMLGCFETQVEVRKEFLAFVAHTK